MDYIFNNMDFFRKFSASEPFGIHLAQYRRETERDCRIQSIGYTPRKANRITAVFETHNFSFILSGKGTYEYKNRMLPVISPCVITQSPGNPTNYGPDSTWEELYLIYGVQDYSTFVKKKLFTASRPIWNIAASGILYDHLTQLMRLLDTINDSFAVDKVDSICEMMVLESISQRTTAGQSREEQVVRELEARMMKNTLSDFDIGTYAQDHGMHEATFRRHWAQFCRLPPDRFLMQLRMGEACRMLVETKNTVSQIAYTLKFEDPLYFSRRFHKDFGCSASEYRNRHRLGEVPPSIMA